MLVERRGNLLKDDAQALVNTVNTVGVMGKGLALQFKRAYPEMFIAYQAACRDGRIRPGSVFAVPVDDGRWVLNFPTKRHWKQRSRLEDITTGLNDLVRLTHELQLTSIAVPPLGCGNGGLDWQTVKPLIVEKLTPLGIPVHLYVPGTPKPEDMVIGARRPELTHNRARLLSAVHRYIRLAWTKGISDRPQASLIEVQKIGYLLQKAGLDLRLSFEPARFGPYSNALHRGLAEMEGHYLLGFGDGTGGARADLKILPKAVEHIETAVIDDREFENAWADVRSAINGYEYPEGMELLASVHFLAEPAGAAADPAWVTARLASWSERKGRLFPLDTVAGALERLTEARLLSRHG